MSFPVGPLEAFETKLVFALLLRDRLRLQDTLEGGVTVTAGLQAGFQKDSSGTFLFFNLSKGSVGFKVRSNPDTPYYLPIDLTVTIPLPSPLWPAFPDLSLADKTLPLWDPNQPAAFRAQFLESCLSPSCAYPFDSGATLVRGTVLKAGAPLAGVTVSDTAGATWPYVTGADGQFVLIFQEPAALPTPVTIRAELAGNPTVDTPVTVLRAVTGTLTIKLGQ
jgi:hypothetical protein